MSAPVPNNEAARLDALRAYEILDTPAEQHFDDITHLATYICGTPIGIITLVDVDRQWFKSKVGLAVDQTARDVAFCAHAILHPSLLIVRDALEDERFATNPLVTADPYIRFYAGAPLVTPAGHALGTLCVIDRVPRDLTPQQSDALAALSRQVIAQLELRRQMRQLAQTTHELADAKAQLADTLTEVEKSRDDLRSILNQLHVGSAITDPAGRLTFISQSCEAILGASADELCGQAWHELGPFTDEQRQQLQTMLQNSPDQRSQVALRIDGRGGRELWVDIAVREEPRDPQRKIFFIYDVSDVHRLRRQLEERAHFQDLVGKSPAMQRVYQQIRNVAAVDSTVLIEGETGTGKELVARAIHSLSPRREQPFVAVNCGGLTESLVASQLFGHRRGAFTGAVEDHKGVFETAEGGTLLLDEIGDIPLTVQTSLLRVLQEREIVRVGESKPRTIDVRVLAATHHSLNDDVTKGTFRSDLFYRIRVARIQLPALHQRREDIPLLVGAMLAQCRATTGKSVQDVSADAMHALLAYRWAGNVRELMGAIEFAVISCNGTVIQCADLPPEIVGGDTRSTSANGIAAEKQRLLEALDAAKGNRAVAAYMLGISRATLFRKLRTLGLTGSSKDPRVSRETR